MIDLILLIAAPFIIAYALASKSAAEMAHSARSSPLGSIDCPER
jgi:hypothetical protein